MIELEKTFLVKKIPADLKNCNSKEITDIYIGEISLASKLRLRKSGDSYELTKKTVPNPTDASSQTEENIVLTESEFNTFLEVKGRIVKKTRYYYEYNNSVVEFDVFQGDLKGLVIAEVEFKTKEEKDSFKTPDFCLADITQEDFIAGIMLAGKFYEDIKENLDRFGYNKLFID